MYVYLSTQAKKRKWSESWSLCCSYIVCKSLHIFSCPGTVQCPSLYIYSDSHTLSSSSLSALFHVKRAIWTAVSLQGFKCKTYHISLTIYDDNFFLPTKQNGHIFNKTNKLKLIQYNTHHSINLSPRICNYHKKNYKCVFYLL